MTRSRRYSALDGMRGIAALFVVSRHFAELRGGGVSDQLTYLAVDFFFVLSGFVLSVSYGERLATGVLSRRRFLVNRVIRLWPLYLLGLVVPSAVAMVDGFVHHNGPFGFFKVLAKALVLFPSNIGHPYAPLFVLNTPSWSLFFELYVANVLFALFSGSGMSRRLVVAVVVGSAALLIASDIHYGSLDVGVDGGTVAGGFPRVIYSFFAGVLIHRFHVEGGRGLHFPAWLPVAALVLIFLVHRHDPGGRLFEVAAVLVLLPAIVVAGARSTVGRAHFWEGLGNTSYAIYVLHFGAIMLTARALRHWDIYPGYAVEAMLMVLLLLVGWAADRGDAVVRRAIMTIADRVGRPRLGHPVRAEASRDR